MKLSEAIRLGAMLNPQTQVGSLSHKGATCAIGGAMKAAGLSLKAFCPYDVAAARWPILNNYTQSPISGFGIDRLMYVIWTLNDSEGWTREQIAEWVASQEALAVPEAVAAVWEAVEQPVVSLRA